MHTRTRDFFLRSSAPPSSSGSQIDMSSRAPEPRLDQTGRKALCASVLNLNLASVARAMGCARGRTWLGLGLGLW